MDGVQIEMSIVLRLNDTLGNWPIRMDRASHPERAWECTLEAMQFCMKCAIKERFYDLAE